MGHYKGTTLNALSIPPPSALFSEGEDQDMEQKKTKINICIKSEIR